MDINLVRSVLTAVVMVVFLAIVWCAYCPKRKERFEHDALLPFGEDDDSGARR